MSPEKFLALAIKAKCYCNAAWVISLFTITQETEEQKKKIYPGKLTVEPFGFFCYDEELKAIKIETTKTTDQPLFSVKDKITLSPEIYPGLKETKLESTIGLLFLNLIAVYSPFKGKIAYINKRFSPSYVEEIVNKVGESDPTDPSQKNQDKIYMEDYILFHRAVSYLESFSTIFSHSITQVGILPPPGRRAFKAELLKKYENKLRDPVEMAKFEAELSGFDAEYLKNDPSIGKFMSGKNTKARVSAYLTQGGQSNEFLGSMESTPVIQALEDGIPRDQEGFVATTNTLRYGSFSRGAETVNGGVVAKDLLRAADNWHIEPGDCKTPFGIERHYSDDEISEIVNRYLILPNGKLFLVPDTEAAKPFSNKKIIVRSPQYCRSPGTTTCEVCAGVALSKHPDGLTIPLTDISGGILADSLKKMHDSKLSTVTANLKAVIS